MSFAAFVLSTGRCGTQWLAATLAELFGNEIYVEHEPLHDQYNTRETLGLYSSNQQFEALPLKVRSHIKAIEERISSRPYIECGYPCWSTIPYLAHYFGKNLRVIHLTRHPVHTSYSWLTHFAYQKPLFPHIPEKVLLSPFDKGIKFTEYQTHWKNLGPFEKCLFYWSEVQAFALAQESCLDLPWLLIRYDDLFSKAGLAKICRFLDCSFNPMDTELEPRIVDNFKYITPVWQDWKIIKEHPHAVSLAEKLGYNLNDINDEHLIKRYIKGL